MPKRGGSKEMSDLKGRIVRMVHSKRRKVKMYSVLYEGLKPQAINDLMERKLKEE